MLNKSESLICRMRLKENRWHRLTMTEQGAFLDAYDDAGSRERGTNLLLDALGKSSSSG
jgi:hypothetical protein